MRDEYTMISKNGPLFSSHYIDEYDDHISQTFAYNELRNDRLILGAYSYAGYGHLDLTRIWLRLFEGK